jgi:cytochrome c oxidase assembly protein subunit 15
MMLKTLRRLTNIAILLALLVVMLGAYTRLTDAGLGCPDWPGCYGRMVLPMQQHELTQAQTMYPAVPIETRKAWTEMVHRYAAGTLALLIVTIGLTACWKRRRLRVSAVVPCTLIILVLYQALLGMWTVTLKLLPVVVMGHLLGGILIFALLCFFRSQLSRQVPYTTSWHTWIGIGAAIVLLQIALGGWVSSNYAGISCIGFPKCNGLWWPDLHFSRGFNVWSPVGANYQGGVLDSASRVTILFIHRLGAVVTAMYVLALACMLWIRCKYPMIRILSGSVIVTVLVQFTLGILNVVYLMPLWVAVAHNGVAAVLFAMMLSLLYFTRGEPVNHAQVQ